MTTKLSIVVSGMIAADPRQGGATWAVLQYVLGFVQLGHEVLLLEPIQARSLRPAGTALEASDNARYFADVQTEFGLRGRSALLLAGTRQTFGLPYERLLEITRRADVLVNISGMLTDAELLSAIPVRVYLDLDPGFNQLWHAAQGIDMRYQGHTHFMTVGQSIGEPDCPVPTCGLKWLKTLPPVVLGRWLAATQVQYDALTTVANWRGYGSIQHEGVAYGQKAHSLRQFFTLPQIVPEKFMLAMAVHRDEHKDLAALAENGWALLDPAAVAGTPADYQTFIRHSKAEFGIAKSGYVASRSGWFSDRSACYLASGRPVIAQETGFSRHLPVGEGLFAFSTGGDVLNAVDHLRTEYPKHASAARALALEHFDSNKVLTRLLQQVGG